MFYSEIEQITNSFSVNTVATHDILVSETERLTDSFVCNTSVNEDSFVLDTEQPTDSFLDNTPVNDESFVSDTLVADSVGVSVQTTDAFSLCLADCKDIQTKWLSEKSAFRHIDLNN